MCSFYYQRGRSAAAAIAMAFFAIAAGRVWREEGGVVMLTLAGFMTIAAARSALLATDRQPALKFDRHSLWVRKAWGGMAQVPWGELHDATLKAHSVRYMGLIPVSRHVHLTITCDGGVFGARRYRVSTTAMGMSPAQSAAMLSGLKQAQLDAIGEAGVAMAGAGTRGWGVDINQNEPQGLFDADAAMARYLAAKVGREPAAAGAARASQRAMPFRPSFGRRIS